MAIVTIAIGIATITSLLAGAISMSSGIARDTIRAKYGKQLNKVAKKISPRLNENEQLRSQINTALTNQNQKLASDLLMASPLSSVVKRLKENIQLNEKGSQETDRYFDEQKDLAEQAQGAADKISSALDGDVAAATEGKHAWIGSSGNQIRDNVSKLESNFDEVKKKLQEAKKSKSVPVVSPSQPNTSTNIGSMDRKVHGAIPGITMKGNH